MSRGGSWVALVWTFASLACARVTTHPVYVHTWSLATDTPSDCTGVTDQDQAEGLWPMAFWIAGEPGVLHAGDEVWMFEIRDRTAWYRTGWSGAALAKRRYEPIGERRGFEVTLTCGDDTYEFEELECPSERGLIVYVDSQTLGSLGSAHAPCQLRVELRTDEQRWVHVQDGVLVRPDVRGIARH
ncbi:hypothetical protein [Enhygromyxa salina]|uniref:Lipoprotein n=1 Tax=Enhygromyxa salina TaxID=215803 RepID=A0A2S9YAE3_9BACT|nr:hypothetical protein [Enhygromyxa salina]PRQ01986.1 hypothetical protein ENSA7_56530 [Enhygromyxa salina]